MNPAITPRLSGVLKQQPRDRDAEQDREADALQLRPTSCSPTPAVRTTRRGSRCSRTAKSWLTNSSISLGVLRLDCSFVVAGHPQRDQHSDEEERHGRAEPPPPGPVGDHRERHRPKPDELAPQRRVGTGHRRTRLRHQAGQPPDEHRIGRRGPHHRQVRRHPLVEVDKLVDLRASQPPTPLHQRLEPVPRRAMRQHERVDIHMANPSSVIEYGPPARTSGDRGRGGPGCPDRPATGSRVVGDDRHHRGVHRLHRSVCCCGRPRSRSSTPRFRRRC